MRTKEKRRNIELAIMCAILAFLAVLALGLTASAEESSEVIAVIYTEDYLEKLNAQETVVGVEPGSEEKTYTNGNAEEFVDNPYQLIQFTDGEMEELRWVIALEAQGEGYKGEVAVCEAIFNRVLSARDWGGSIHGVLSKKGQFSTYKLIGSSRAWCVPGEMEDDVISDVLRSGCTVLPDLHYVYFDSRGGVNGSRKIKIGHHTFGAERA